MCTFLFEYTHTHTHIGGLRGKVLEWMQDYLKNTEMRMVIRGETLSWRNVTSGVPQGSVLAPMMFQIYVNDVQYGVTSYICESVCR